MIFDINATLTEASNILQQKTKLVTDYNLIEEIAKLLPETTEESELCVIALANKIIEESELFNTEEKGKVLIALSVLAGKYNDRGEIGEVMHSFNEIIGIRNHKDNKDKVDHIIQNVVHQIIETNINGREEEDKWGMMYH